MSINTVNDPILIEHTEIEENKSNSTIFASKSGSKYYYSWCKSRVKEENRVFFDSSEEAREAGYEKAKNCPGE